jgi:UDP-N-acetylglucosamine 4,6-dehydratase
MFKNKKILITGGTGSWGYELVRQLIPYKPKKMVVYSRNESKQVDMMRAFDDPSLNSCIGDVRDKNALIKACKGVDYVFHLAALKHVPVCEDQPYEALKTNVLGTQNLIEAAIANKVKKVINISTDKAADPSNFYGMTKAIGEKLIVYSNLLSPETRLFNVRGGNVMGTSGSVIQLFMKQIKERNQINITDKNMTRFFITQEDAIGLLLKAAEQGYGGEIFVMMTPTCKIIDLAEVLIDSMAKGHVKIAELGIRPGEKIHEILYSKHESQSTVIYNQQYLVILPSIHIPGLKEKYKPYPCVSIGNYSSSESLLSKHEIKELLIKGGFLS